VYKLKCSYDSTYIGKTIRNLSLRIKEYHTGNKTGAQSDVTKHFGKPFTFYQVQRTGNPN